MGSALLKISFRSVLNARCKRYYIGQNADGRNSKSGVVIEIGCDKSNSKFSKQKTKNPNTYMSRNIQHT